MAGGPTRYRQAYNAGTEGRGLSEGLASLADKDPLIDSAHDAGRAGTPFADWQKANGQGPAFKPKAADVPPDTPQPPPSTSSGRKGGKGQRGTRGYRGRSTSGSGNLGIRRTARNASVVNPTGGALPVGLTAGAGAAGLFFGAIAYALVLSVVDYGPTGPVLWFKAKFLNVPAGQSSTASTANAKPAVAGNQSVASPSAPAAGALA